MLVPAPNVLEIRADPARPGTGWLGSGFRIFPCRLGRAGVTEAKIEGDGKTPAGIFPLRRVFYRADRVALIETRRPLAAIEPDDLWCDDPSHPHYNRLVRRPFGGRTEALWRGDGAYDVVVVLGHNDDPPIPGMGSAIFIHLAHTDDRPTAGCIALARAHLFGLLRTAGPGDVARVQPPS